MWSMKRPLNAIHVPSQRMRVVMLSILEIRLSGSLGSVCCRNAIQDHTLPITCSPTYTRRHKRTAQGKPHLYYDQAL